jgi:RNA polymerase sigma-54 factor
MQGQPALQITQAKSLTMTGALRQAISLLQLSNLELAAHLEKLAQTNTCLILHPSPAPVRAWLSDRAMSGAAPRSGSAAKGHVDATERAAQTPAGLYDHVMAQVPLLVRATADRPIAESYVAALDANGWLGCSVADVARDCGCTMARAEAVLHALQQAEPAGLFSRNLAECLRLQAIDQGVFDPVFERLLTNLPLLAQGDLAAVAARIGCEVDQVAAMLRTIRRMNPKPGASYDGDVAPITEPDVIVRQDGGRWTVELNRSTLPVVEVAQVDTASDDLRDARWLVRAVSRRNATTLRIARALVAHQMEFVVHGVAHLRPLTLVDLAAQTDLHISTISRITSGMLVALPRTTLPLRDFFARGMGGAEGPTTAAIRQQIAGLVAAENPDEPLTDAQIQALFAQKGIPLARRTVAKYRQSLRIGASGARRRKGRLDRAAPRRPASA